MTAREQIDRLTADAEAALALVGGCTLAPSPTVSAALVRLGHLIRAIGDVGRGAELARLATENARGAS